jgi:hypothetical protein
MNFFALELERKKKFRPTDISKYLSPTAVGEKKGIKVKYSLYFIHIFFFRYLL